MVLQISFLLLFLLKVLIRALLIVSEKILKEHNLTPLARIAHISVRADDPIWMLTAPMPATEYAVKKSGIKPVLLADN